MPAYALALAKFAITVAMVLALSEVARRSNPRLAGVLVGLPLGAGLSVYFFTLERGVSFTLAALPWGVAGLSAALAFSLAYAAAGRLFKLPGRVRPVLASSLAGIACYVAAASGIRALPLDLPRATLLTVAALAVNFAGFRALGFPKSPGLKKPMGLGVVAFRAGTAGLVVTAVTSAAGAFGPTWSGILSAFPALLFPLVLVLHYEEGDALYPGVIQGFGYGIINLIGFYLLSAVLLPRMGLNAAFALLYAASALVLSFIAAVRSRLERGPARADDEPSRA